MLETAPSTSSCKTSRYYREHHLQTHHQKSASHPRHHRPRNTKQRHRCYRRHTQQHYRILLEHLHRKQPLRRRGTILARPKPARPAAPAHTSRLLQNHKTGRKRRQTIPLEHTATTTMENMDTTRTQRHRIRTLHQPENTLRHTNQQPG